MALSKMLKVIQGDASADNKISTYHNFYRHTKNIVFVIFSDIVFLRCFLMNCEEFKELWSPFFKSH